MERPDGDEVGVLCPHLPFGDHVGERRDRESERNGQSDDAETLRHERKNEEEQQERRGERARPKERRERRLPGFLGKGIHK